MRVLVRSRHGNFLLAVVGAIYALSALAVLVWFVTDVWQAATFADFALQVALLACAACGVWFLSIGLDNLRGGESQAATAKPASIHR